MAMNLTRADLARAASRAESMRNRMNTLRKKTEKIAERAVHTVEVGAAAFGFGMLHGSTFDPATGKAGVNVFGIPLELMAGVGFHAAGFLGLGGKMSNHLHGFGDGAIAAFLTTTGVDVGLDLMKKKQTGAAATLPAGGGSGILENTVVMPRGLSTSAQQREYADAALQRSIAEAEAARTMAAVAP